MTNANQGVTVKV